MEYLFANLFVSSVPHTIVIWAESKFSFCQRISLDKRSNSIESSSEGPTISQSINLILVHTKLSKLPLRLLELSKFSNFTKAYLNFDIILSKVSSSKATIPGMISSQSTIFEELKIKIQANDIFHIVSNYFVFRIHVGTDSWASLSLPVCDSVCDKEIMEIRKPRLEKW